MNERDYERGNRAAWSRMLQECVRQLGIDDPAARGAAWILEREAAVAMLREACEHHGDNDWPDDLHMGDVIEKHLLRHLEAE